jgi:cell wall-associated NlpC family hydrolase
MRKIKKISLALVVIPLIQTGCMQDNLTKKITPSKSIDKNTTFNSSSEIEETVLVDRTLEDNTSYINVNENSPNHIVLTEINTTTTDTTIMDSLDEIIEYEDNISNEIISIDENMVVDNSIGDSWSQLTKEDEIIETAKSFIGTKYVWAANGPDCFDCSGFTKYVFKENGITLPRYSGHQAKVGIRVSFDELKKGDLVFFDTERKFRGKVNHVGIYIGDNKFIHASSAKKKVIITSFNKKPFYRRRFLRGERVINYSDIYASL